MARSKHEGTIYKRKGKPGWFGRVQLGNKQSYTSDSTKAGVLKNIRQLKLEHEKLIQSKGTVFDYLDKWCESRKIAPSYLRNRRMNIERCKSIYDIQLRDLKAEHITTLYDKLFDQGLSSSSVRQVHALLNKALGDATKAKRLLVNPMADVQSDDKPQQQSREMSDMNDIHVAKLLKVDNEWRPMFTLMIATGIRSGEARGLKWSDVDLDNKLIHIRRQLTKDVNGDLILRKPKTKKSIRSLALDEIVIQQLQIHLQHQQRYIADQGAQLTNPERQAWVEHWSKKDLVFTNDLGGFMHDKIPYNALKDTLREAGVEKHYRIHDLRHTYATRALRNGINPVIVQETLGHSKVSTTLEIYSHVDLNMHRAAARVIGSGLEQVING